ncbi:DUF742 domain-containing protein [Solihabitans fulvus]|uniref:DUF742 domain-containing protein n=1 Tax=Solihabitans fulvus TaxID=1892852 RepID=A0A5B2WBV1_9PSEU|nr:DUF742 domain-containing protein [Solihabitans fulvus]KAA2248735.1 DUF742 domain-containing protein [Solihabitans fulvus]
MSPDGGQADNGTRGRQDESDDSFAFLMNGFSLDSTRRKDKDGEQGPGRRRRNNDDDNRLLSDTLAAGQHDLEDDEEESASIVRAYTWTGGRTKSDYQLEIETLVSVSDTGYNPAAVMQVEYHEVARLCGQPRSVAEVAALLSLPLGVAKVLLGDMAGLGVIVVHETASADGNLPNMALLERVLSGLRRL